MGAKSAEDVLMPLRISTNYRGGRQRIFLDTEGQTSTSFPAWLMAYLGGPPGEGRCWDAAAGVRLGDTPEPPGATAAGASAGPVWKLSGGRKCPGLSVPTLAMGLLLVF